MSLRHFIIKWQRTTHLSANKNNEKCFYSLYGDIRAKVEGTELPIQSKGPRFMHWDVIYEKRFLRINTVRKYSTTSNRR